MKLGKSIVRSDIYDMMSNGEYSPMDFHIFYHFIKIYVLQSSQNKKYVIITRQVHVHIRDRILSDYTISGQSI